MPRNPYRREPYASLTAALSGDIGRWQGETLGKGRFAIVNPDIDGLLSFCILKAADSSLKLGGYYLNESVMLLTNEASAHLDGLAGSTPRTADFLSVENDLLIMDSIGQHFCLLDDPGYAKVNPNTLRYGRQEPPATLIRRHFRNKYPLSTAFFVWSLLNPGKTLTDGQLVTLLYPDSAITKDFAHTYQSNVAGWFEWLGHTKALRNFLCLAQSVGVLQVARCFFKKLHTTQPGLSFDLVDGFATINNAEIIDTALAYFCGLLNISPQTIDPGRLREGHKYYYTRVNVERQATAGDRQKILFEWLTETLVEPVRVKEFDKNATASGIRRVVSEALVTFGEWSVTTSEKWSPLVSDKVKVHHRVVPGRHVELPSHIASMKLREPCKTAPFGCVWGRCVAQS